MPKRYKFQVVAAPNSFTWKYVDGNEKPPKVLEESARTWDTRQAAKDAIKNMKEADVEDA
jgi:hypothetical protein